MDRTIALVVAGLVGIALAGGMVVADGEPTAERTLGDTTAAPGDTVAVTMAIELSEAGEIDYVDEFDPAFDGAELVSVTVDGEETAPLLQEVDGEAALFVLPELGPGTVEITYEVTVAADAQPGSTHTFDGSVQVDGNEIPVDGDTELTVSGDDPAPATFAVEIDAEGTDESVVAGEEATVVATVENTGDESGTQEVTLSIDGSEEASESVTLGAGETESVTFGYETSEGDVPEVEATVASDDDTASTTISVEEGDRNGNGDGNGDGTGDGTTDDATDEIVPGFGIAVALVALLSLVVVLGRRSV